METTSSNNNTSAVSKTSLWIGRIIRVLCIVFLLFDAICKIIKEIHSVQASATLGLPENTIPVVGVVLLVCTIIYTIPRTAIIGAILLTGYLGGAAAIMMRAGQQVYFSLMFGLLVWLGLYLRDGKANFFRNFISR